MSDVTPRRAALVTGGSGGIGRAAAERLAGDGMAVAVHYAGNKDRAQRVVDGITAAGGTGMVVGGDVADQRLMVEAFDAVEAAYGGVDVVVHTAGIMILSSVAELDLDAFDRMHRTNVRGTVVVAQQAARRVRVGGSIVLFSTSVTRTSFPDYAGYVATKGAVEAIVPVLAKEMRGRDVTVNAVAPGPTATPLFLEGKSDEQVHRLADAVPLERLGQPTDIAEAVAYLAGPGRWTNGQTLFVNGGLA